jgi:hypothetical protein
LAESRADHSYSEALRNSQISKNFVEKVLFLREKEAFFGALFRTTLIGAVELRMAIPSQNGWNLSPRKPPKSGAFCAESRKIQIFRAAAPCLSPPKALLKPD